MARSILALLLLTVFCPPAFAQAQEPGKTIVPGLNLQVVPEVVYAQIPQLPTGQGLVVEQVAPGSVAAKLDLQRHDILLSYGEQTLHDLDQFNRVVLATKLDHKAKLVLLRAGKEVKLDVALHSADQVKHNIKGSIKPGGPPSVGIECTYLDGGKMQIVFVYYSEASSKLETFTCTGSLPEIETQVRQRHLPARVQEVVDVAIKRLKKS